jgi:hypothetical protein
MTGRDSEQVCKVFVVVRGMRRCLICDWVFTPKEAADHASVLCYPRPEQLQKKCPETATALRG